MDTQTNPFREALARWDSGELGWIKEDYDLTHFEGTNRPRLVGVCSVGMVALNKFGRPGYLALDEDGGRSVPEICALAEVVLEQYPKAAHYSATNLISIIAGWQDEEETTYDDVRTVFEKAAVRWDELS